MVLFDYHFVEFVQKNVFIIFVFANINGYFVIVVLVFVLITFKLMFITLFPIEEVHICVKLDSKMDLFDYHFVEFVQKNVFIIFVFANINRYVVIEVLVFCSNSIKMEV
jgi:hypothetical protein